MNDLQSSMQTPSADFAINTLSVAFQYILERADLTEEERGALRAAQAATDVAFSLIWLRVHSNAEVDEPPPREEWPSVMDAAETPFADNH